MLKRRLDARSYRAWHIAQAKTKKIKDSNGSVPGQGNMLSMYHCDKIEAACSREGDSKSERFQLQQQSTDHAVKSQPGEGKATPEKLVPSVPEGCEKTPSSTDLQMNGVTVGVIRDGAIGDKQDSSDYCDKMLSLDSGSDGRRADEVNDEAANGAHRLEKKKGPPRFIEYWVPVSFSHLQLEKYCETLIKHSWLLCASTKKNVIDGLHDVLARIKECCDHPYLVDPSLQSYVNEGRPTVDFLNTGTESSGKLLLLDKLLQELRRKSLRVVIVFQQSKHSKSHSVELRHLLNDFICERFGEESYVHIYRDVDRLKNRAALDLFNDKGSGRFVLLMEKCCCQPRIKLSSVDFIILFNSDWSPINDMKCLRKMSFQLTHNHLKVLRLYSPNSVEEKVLTLAKDGNIFESSILCLSYNVCHMLLLWGVTDLLSRLEDFHRQCTSIANLTSLSEENLVLTAKDELFMLLSCQDNNSYSFSIVSKVPEGNDYVSSGLKLHGEGDAPARDDDIPPHTIWRSLLEGKHPRWRLLPESSDAVRRRAEASTSLSPYAESENENENDRTTSKRTPLFQDKFICKKLRSPKVLGKKVHKLSGNPDPGGRANGLSLRRDGCTGSIAVQRTCMRRMRELLAKQKKEIREFYRSKQQERAKLDEEHQLELNLINKGCRIGAAREVELKKLEDSYEEKLEEYNHQMDMKRKELEAAQRASRIKERRFKDKLISLSKLKNDKKHIFALVNDSVLWPQSDNLTENAIDPLVTMSDAAAFSKGRASEEIEAGVRDESIRLRNPGLPDSVMTEKEILLAESNGQNDAVSVLKEAGLNTSDHDDRLLVPSVTGSVTVSHIEKQSQDMLLAPKIDEGISCTNSEHYKEAMQGITVEKQAFEDLDGESNVVPVCPVSNTTSRDDCLVAVNDSLESGGENDVVAYSGETLNASVSPIDHGSISCISNEPQLCDLSEQNDLESMSKLSTREVQHDSSKTSDGKFIRVVDSKAAAIVSNTFTVVAPLNVQGPSELPSSRVGNGSLGQSQAVRTSVRALPLEQSTGPLCTPTIEMRQNSEVSFVSNCPTSQTRSCQPDESEVPLRNSELVNLPVFLPPALPSDQFQAPLSNLGSANMCMLQWPLQSSVGHNQPQQQTVSGTTILQPSNNCQDSLSVRFDRPSFGNCDPLADELKKMKREVEEAIKIHEDKTMQLNSACQKELEEVRKKYDLLLQEADVELLEKKVALESICTKVRAHKLLAETLNYQYLKHQSPLASQDAILNAILELPLLQQCNMLAPRTVPASVASTAPTTTPQVVHQLSDLISTVPARPQRPPSLYIPRNPQACYPMRSPIHCPAPHLPYRPLRTPMPISNIESTVTALPNQQFSELSHGLLSGRHQQLFSPVVLPQIDGNIDCPVVL